MTHQVSTVVPVPKVQIVNNKPTASSLDVAEFFGKRHDHVLRDIKILAEENTEGVMIMFLLTPNEYLDTVRITAKNCYSTVLQPRKNVGFFVFEIRFGVWSATNKPLWVNKSAGVLSGFWLQTPFLFGEEVNINLPKKETVQ